MAPLLTQAEIQESASPLSDGTVDESKLRCTRKFKDFIQAIDFVNKLVEPAESAGDHLDIDISYNRVELHTDNT